MEDVIAGLLKLSMLDEDGDDPCVGATCGYAGGCTCWLHWVGAIAGCTGWVHLLSALVVQLLVTLDGQYSAG